MGDFRLQTGNLPTPRRTESAKEDPAALKERREALRSTNQPARRANDEEGGWRTVTKPATQQTARTTRERGEREPPRERAGGREGQRNGTERRGERVAADRGERRRWNDDVPDVSGRLPSGTPAWMESDLPAQLSSSLPDGSGHADPLQAFKAQMREMERQQHGDVVEAATAPAPPPSAPPAFNDPAITSQSSAAPLTAQSSSALLERRGEASDASESRPRASRFAKFFNDGKPAASQPLEAPPAPVSAFSPPPSVPMPPASAPPANMHQTTDMESMRRVMDMLQFSVRR